MAGLSLANRSYDASEALQSGLSEDVNLATVTIPSGLSGRGLDARLTISSSCT